MIFTCRSATAGRFLFCFAAAVAYYDDTSEDHQCRENFLPGECIHTEVDAYDNSNDWLNVAVHAHKGWSDALLTYWDKEICDKCSTDDQISEFSKLNGWDG